MLAGAVAVTYHVPGLAAPLRLAPEVLADLFLGRIARWDDPRLAVLNPGARLPALDVIVVHRAEGSGTTYILTDYLSAVSDAWRAGPGRGTAVRWPVGLGVRGNDGVAGLVRQTPGAVGYVEAAYAARVGLPAAALRNRAGRFVGPSPAATAAATAAVAADTGAARVSLVDASGADSYPVASLTWLLLDRTSRAPARTRAVATFARWALRDGGADARALGYAPLPPGLAARADAALAALGGDAAEGRR
jgi:phosphate transport system substrate-binding protein